MKRALLCVALAILTVPPSAADSLQDGWQLWNGCREIRLVVEELSDDAINLGLEEEAIGTMARSRLRAARIYSDKPMLGTSKTPRDALYIRAGVVGNSFSCKVSFIRWLENERALIGVGRGETWAVSSLGQHGKSSTYIMADLSEKVDKFVDEYLRVNADFCK